MPPHHSFIIFLVTNTNTLLSDLYLISTYNNCEKYQYHNPVCQCPLGLIPHFYIIKKSFDAKGIKVCQCPLGLIPHFYFIARREIRHGMNFVSMPSRAYTSFLRYPFKNLGFMRFPEPVFAGIYQNILTTAVFRAC